MNKNISGYSISQKIEFYFIDSKLEGVITNIDEKNNNLTVITPKGITHKVFLSEKESKFCYIA